MKTMMISLNAMAIVFLFTHLDAGGPLEPNTEAFIQTLAAKGGPTNLLHSTRQRESRQREPDSVYPNTKAAYPFCRLSVRRLLVHQTAGSGDALIRHPFALRKQHQPIITFPHQPIGHTQD